MLNKTASSREKLEKAVTGYKPKKSARFLLSSQVKPGQIRAAIKKYASGVQEAQVVALMDTTMFSSGKDGYLMTCSHLYTCSIRKQAVPLANIRSVQTDDTYMVLTYHDGTQERFYGGIYCEDLSDLLTRLTSEPAAAPAPDPVPQAKAPEKGSGAFMKAAPKPLPRTRTSKSGVRLPVRGQAILCPHCGFLFPAIPGEKRMGDASGNLPEGMYECECTVCYSILAWPKSETAALIRNLTMLKQGVTICTDGYRSKWVPAERISQPVEVDLELACKVCLGPVRFAPGKSSGTCGYCGVRWELDPEKNEPELFAISDDPRYDCRQDADNPELLFTIFEKLLNRMLELAAPSLSDTQQQEYRKMIRQTVASRNESWARMLQTRLGSLLQAQGISGDDVRNQVVSDHFDKIQSQNAELAETADALLKAGKIEDLLRCLDRAIAKGSDLAQSMKGVLMVHKVFPQNGRHDSEYYGEAIRLMEQAAFQGNTMAMKNACATALGDYTFYTSQNSHAVYWAHRVAHRDADAGRRLIRRAQVSRERYLWVHYDSDFRGTREEVTGRKFREYCLAKLEKVALAEHAGAALTLIREGKEDPCWRALLQPGKLVAFGESGLRPLYWWILERQEDQILVLADNILRYEPFHKGGDSAWETSYARKYLNRDLFKMIFSRREQEMIPALRMTNGRSVTEDRLFLLSEEELRRYLGVRQQENEQKVWDPMCGCVPTDWAADRTTLEKEAREQTPWALRTPGTNSRCIMAVTPQNVLETEGLAAQRYFGLRPAMWIRIK